MRAIALGSHRSPRERELRQMPTVSPMEKRPSALQRNCEIVWLPLAMTVKRAYTVANVRFGPSPTLAIPLGVSDVSANVVDDNDPGEPTECSAL